MHLLTKSNFVIAILALITPIGHLFAQDQTSIANNKRNYKPQIIPIKCLSIEIQVSRDHKMSRFKLVVNLTYTF